MPVFLLDFAIIESFIIFSFTDRYVQKCGSLPVIRLSSSSSSSFNTVSFDFRSFLSSASRTELGCVPNTLSMKNACSCFLVIPTDFNLDLQFSLRWLEHLRPVALGIVSANASDRAFSPSVTYPRAFLDNSGQLAETADAIFL